MNSLTVTSQWFGSPMKLEEQFKWKAEIESKEFFGTITSRYTYKTKEEAVEAFHGLKKEFPRLFENF